MNPDFGNIALAAARMASRKKSQNEISYEGIGRNAVAHSKSRGNHHRHQDEDDEDDEENRSTTNVVDLKEFANALKTFPETILKAVLEIYHKHEERKKYAGDDEDPMGEEQSRSRKLKQDVYQDHESFIIADDDITVHEMRLPEFLRPLHQYAIPKDELDTQHQYVFRFLLDGRLQFFQKNYLPFEHAPLDANTAYRAKLNLSGLKQTESALPRGMGSDRGSFKGRIQWKRGNKTSSINPPPTTTPAFCPLGDRRPSVAALNTLRQNHANINIDTAEDDETGELISLIGDDEDSGDYFDKDILGIDILQSEGGVSEDVFDGLTSKRLLSMSDPDYIHAPLIDTLRPRYTPLPFTPNVSHMNLLFKFKSFSLDHLELPIEPMFCSITLFDVQARRKLSETFRFTIHNDANTLEKLGVQEGSFPRDWAESNARFQQAILSIPEPNPNIYAVLFVEKILQNNSGTEHYVKPLNKSALTIKRRGNDTMFSIQTMMGKIKESYEYLAPYRQPMLWSFEPLFEMVDVDDSNNNNSNSLHPYGDGYDNRDISLRTATETYSEADDDDTLNAYDGADDDEFDLDTLEPSSLSVPMSPGPLSHFRDSTASPNSLSTNSYLAGSPRMSDTDSLQITLSPSGPQFPRENEMAPSHRSSTSSLATSSILGDRLSVGSHTSRTRSHSISSATPLAAYITAQTEKRSSSTENAYRNVRLRSGVFTFSRLYSHAKTDGKHRESVCHMILELTKRPVVAPDGTLYSANSIASASASTSGKRVKSVNASGSSKRRRKRVRGSFCMKIATLNDEESLEQWLSPSQREYEGRKPKVLRNEWDELDHLDRLRQQEFHHAQTLHNGVNYVSPLHLDYKHTLYIYPDNFNFTNLGLKDINPRNIVIRVLLRDNDNVDKRGMPTDSVKCIVAPHSRNDAAGAGRQYQYHAISTVNYKNKYPQFFEEIRVDLPMPFTKYHHLLFEFYHISTKKPSKLRLSSDGMGFAEKYCIGFSIVRLLECEQVKDGWHTQPVYKHLVKGYLEKRIDANKDMESTFSSVMGANPDAGKESPRLASRAPTSLSHGMETYNNGKHIFRYSLQLRSSLYPQEERSMSFMRASTNLVEKESSNSNLSNFFGKMLLPRATTAMEQMKQITDWNSVITYFPSIINTFIYVMSNTKGTGEEQSEVTRSPSSKRNTQQTRPSTNTPPHRLDSNSIHALNAAFETMLTVVRGCVRLSNRIRRLDHDERDNFIAGPYVSFFFTNPERSCRPVYAVLVEQWNQFMTNCVQKERETKVIKMQEENISEMAAHSNAISGALSATGTIKKSLRMRGFSLMRKSKRASIRDSNTAATDISNASPETSSFKRNSTRVPPVDPVTTKDSLQLSWFLFDLIVKSLLVYTAPKYDETLLHQHDSLQYAYEHGHAMEDVSDKKHSSARHVDNDDDDDDESTDGDEDEDDSDDDDIMPPVSARAKYDTTNPSSSSSSRLGVNNDASGLYMMSAWSAERIGTDQEFFENTRELQRKLVENMCDLLNGNGSDVSIARKTNTNIAVFMCDLLDVAFQPSMREYPDFRQFVFHLLGDYILASEIKKSSIVVLLRLEFLEILVDHDNFIEYCICSNTRSLSTFVINIVCQGLLDSSFKNRTRAIDIMFEKILLKADFNLKYQTEDQRNEISKLFFPFVVRLIEDEDLTKNLSLPEQHKCMLMAAQILRNRRRTEWREWWWRLNHAQRTKKPRSVNYLCSFVSLLFQMLRSISSNSVKIMRKTVKLTVLDIFDCFVHDMMQFLVLPKDWERIKVKRQGRRHQDEETPDEPGHDETDDYTVVFDVKSNYYPLLEECCMLMVKFLDLNTKDEEYTRRFFLPKFYQLLMNVAPRLCTHNDDSNWKACVGVLLKYVEFPLEDNVDEAPVTSNTDSEITSNGNETKQLPFIVDALKILMAPHMKELEEELEQKRDTLKLKIEDDSEENILIDGTQIKAATLDKLVERVTNDREMDPKFREIFFITYRSFTNAFILLDKLIQRFRLSLEQDPDGGDKITLRVINAIKLWIDKHFFDFNGILTTRLVLFLDNEASKVPNVKAFCKNLKRSLSMKLINASESGKRSRKNNVMFSKKPPPAIIPKNFNRYVQFELMDWSSLEFARQLTLIEYDYFRRIEPKECLSGAWAKKTKYLMAPNIAALTDRWNNVTQWVATEILSQPELKMRRILLIKFIEIADALRSINNFNGITEIMAGLSNASIHRLKRTWESLPESVMNTFKELQDLVDQQQSNKKMREALLQAPPPCVPPLSLYLKDLTFMVDGNPDTIRNGLINVFKRRQISKVILEIRQYQQAPYHFERVSYLREVIMKKLFNNLMEDNALWKTSLELEPRQK